MNYLLDTCVIREALELYFEPQAVRHLAGV